LRIAAANFAIETAPVRSGASRVSSWLRIRSAISSSLEGFQMRPAQCLQDEMVLVDTTSTAQRLCGRGSLDLHPNCTACGFWDTGLKPTLPERAVEVVAGDIQPG